MRRFGVIVSLFRHVVGFGELRQGRQRRCDKGEGKKTEGKRPRRWNSSINGFMSLAVVGLTLRMENDIENLTILRRQTLAFHFPSIFFLRDGKHWVLYNIKFNLIDILHTFFMVLLSWIFFFGRSLVTSFPSMMRLAVCDGLIKCVENSDKPCCVASVNE